MKRFLLTMLIVAFVGSVHAQSTDFPDVPEGSYAEDAVARLADLGIILGFPDGTFGGNESFTRYQAALVISRLLDYIDENYAQAGAGSEEDIASLRNAVQEVSSDLDSLSSRVSSIEESAQAGGSEELQQQVEQLSAELESLRAQIESGALQGPEGPQGPPGPQGPAGEPGQAAEAPAQPAEVTPEQPEQVEAPSAGGGGGLYFGLAGLNELSEEFGVRAVLGIDQIFGGIGLRATADYARQTPLDEGTFAAIGHLTYTLGGPSIRAYVGAGAGYQFSDLIQTTETEDALFISGLLGAEYALFGNLGIFVEGMVDYYLDDPEVAPADEYDDIYPTVAAGLNYRF